ncbi:unnamed protein product [Arctogadus glacialis]
MGERMIMAVFRRPVLWNMRIDIYRDKNKTNQAWKEIGEEFGLPEKDCKKRWRDLRDRYVRERRDASGTTASGSAASNRRPWCHAGLMAFIDPFVASRMTTSNMPESCVDESVNESVHESEREAFLAATNSSNSSMEDFVNVSVTESVMNETVANESVANECGE